MADMDFTRKFSLGDQRDLEIKTILTTVYQALQEKGYNPINQIVGYILSEDPTYITNHNNARALIRKVDRDELLQTLVEYYLNHEQFFNSPPGRRAISYIKKEDTYEYLDQLLLFGGTLSVSRLQPSGPPSHRTAQRGTYAGPGVS